MSEGSAKYIASDFNGAVTAFTAASKIELTPLDLYRAQYELAVTYVVQESKASKSTAAVLFKSLALNIAVPPTLRAYSYAQLGFMAADPVLAQKFVFNDEPFSSVLSAADNVRVYAQAELFKRSDALYPTPVVEYKLAYLQAIRVSADAASSTSAVSKNQAVATYLLLQNADSLLAKQPIANYQEATTAKISRARTLAILSPYVSSIAPEIVASSYDDALKMTQNSPNATSTEGYAKTMRILLEYASALSPAAISDSTTESTINKLLAEYLSDVSAAPSAATQTALIIKNPKDYPNIGKQLAYFAKTSAPFAAYLNSIGVSL